MRDVFSKYDIELTDSQVDLLNRYYELLVDGNKRVNLTSITDYDEVVRKHFLDSALLIAPSIDVLDDSKGGRLLDVGSGAGLPGIVLAILCPKLDVGLLDSLGKRIEFLDTVIDELGLSNVHTVKGRAEELARDPDYRQRFDLVTSRAVAGLPVLLELCMPFVSEDGYFFAYKGPGFDEESEAAGHAMDELQVMARDEYRFEVGESARILAAFGWKGSLPDKYPRRPGIPAKRPL